MAYLSIHYYQRYYTTNIDICKDKTNLQQKRAPVSAPFCKKKIRTSIRRTRIPCQTMEKTRYPTTTVLMRVADESPRTLSE